jgi:hypothetical protein
MDFLKTQFDKLLLMAFIIALVCMLLHMISVRPESTAVAWLEKSIDMVTGALLALVTGAVLKSKD